MDKNKKVNKPSNKKIIVSGGSSMVGQNLKPYLPNAKYLSSKDYDLTSQSDVQNMFSQNSSSGKIDTIIHLAAKVGGIQSNIDNPYNYFTDNILMNTFMVDYAVTWGVKRFIGILSTCIYPNMCDSYPLIESMLHDGKPHDSNFGYAISKRAMATQIDAANKKYDLKYSYLIPTNLYGFNDKTGHSSHFISALLNKIKFAIEKGEKKITLMGDGTPLRQCLFSDDLAKIIKMIVDNDITESFNIAPDENLSIKQIAEIALDICGVNNFKIQWDKSKPSGQHRKDVGSEKLKKIFPEFKFTSLQDGIKHTWNTIKPAI